MVLIVFCRWVRLSNQILSDLFLENVFVLTVGESLNIFKAEMILLCEIISRVGNKYTVSCLASISRSCAGDCSHP